MAVDKESKRERKKQSKISNEDSIESSQDIFEKAEMGKHEANEFDDRIEHDMKKKKKKKEKREKEKRVEENEETDACNTNESDSKPRKKRKGKDELNEESSLGLKKAKKRKAEEKEVECKESDEETAVCNSKGSDSKQKKKKKEKDKSNEDSSLGKIDQSILQQAVTNLGLPIEDEAPTEMPMKKKKKKKDMETNLDQTNSNDADVQPEESTRWNRCLHYLKQWSTDRDNWRFKKASQVQLLKIMYDKSQMSDNYFDMMLQYLEDIKGKGRDKSREDAEKLLKEDSDTQSSQDPDKVNRARQIFQLLS